jgi:DnaJ-class molecular chaperone
VKVLKVDGTKWCSYCDKPGECPHCDGIGLLKALRDTLPYEYDIECEFCNGSGFCPWCMDISPISAASENRGQQ